MTKQGNYLGRVSALTECSSASCGEAKQLFESSVHPLSGFFPALYRANFRSRWSEIEVLNTLSDFALLLLSLYSLTKSVIQYNEGLIQIN